jgi:predicted Zn-dependent protease with MMP-like domain
MRGPAYGPLGTDDPIGPRVPAYRTRRELFDQVAVDVMTDVESRWSEELADLELAVEDIPLLPITWVAPRVPLASLVPATAATPPRLVLFRRPIEHRAESRVDLEALVLTVVAEQLADYLGVPAEDVHPDYEP